jgi:RNA polymerase sigma-70 factor (ECF subfamily)
LSEQDVALWDGAAIEAAERPLSEASEARAPGRFQHEAGVQSVHTARAFLIERLGEMA